MIQQIIVAILFVAAFYYVGRKIYRSVSNKKGCASGCAGCAVDFNKIKQTEAKNT